jgi:hypothetical protein
VKSSRSDGVVDYVGKVLKTYCAQKGIIKEGKKFHEHHQNGIAEGVNRTMGDIGRMMLVVAKMEKNMWPYANGMATYILNWMLNFRTGQKAP